MESIIINGKRMIPAHGDHGQILAKTGPIKTSGAFAKCKSTLIHSQNPRALMNGANARRNMTLVYGNGKILSRKEARSKNDRLRGVNVSIGTGIDPNLASY
tara:strand:- start:1083 stop:1385 length:303 start_codon:yes stop_codon:yes gene_type:complete